MDLILVELKICHDCFKKNYIRYESCRSMYLERGMDVDWVNNRIDKLINTAVGNFYKYIMNYVVFNLLISGVNRRDLYSKTTFHKVVNNKKKTTINRFDDLVDFIDMYIKYM